MSAVAPANQTVDFIRSKIRTLTACSSEQELPTSLIDQYINNFYNSDFPYAIKLDQMRDVYEFFTQPYVDTYPVDVNYIQGIRSPVYVDGISAYFYKDRREFFNLWPQWPSLFKPISGDGVTTHFTFTLPGPFLRNQVTIGGVDVSGNAIQVTDDGAGGLWSQNPNPVTTVPAYRTVPPTNPPIPGMHNQNTGNPGLNEQTFVGVVNYVTGAFDVTFLSPPADGTQCTTFISQYQTGRPWSLLFWNNYFQIRPIPKFVHKITVEVYLTPVQFMLSNDSPILNQWAQYLAYGAALEILRDRQDMEGVANLMEGFKRQEALVLERQGVEEIGQRNITIFSGNVPNLGWNNFWGGWY